MSSFIGYRPEDVTDVNANTIVGFGVTDINSIYQQNLSPTKWLEDKTSEGEKINIDLNNRFVLTDSGEYIGNSARRVRFRIKPDGTKLYILNADDVIRQYTLPVAWDLTSATDDNISYNVASKDNTPTDFFFDSTGTKLFIYGQQYDKLIKVTLTTGWDLSTAVVITDSSVQTNTNSFAAQYSNFYGFNFNSTGTKLYIMDQAAVGGRSIHEFSLSTAWDLETIELVPGNASQYNPSYSYIFSKDDYNTFESRYFTFSSHGKYLYILGGSSNDTALRIYYLPTAWDLSTTRFHTKIDIASKLSISNYGIAMYASSFEISDDGYNFIFGYSNDASYTNRRIFAGSTPVPYVFSNYTRKSQISILKGTEEGQGNYFKADGTSLYVVDSSTSSIYQYDLSEPWNIQTAAQNLSSITGVSSQEESPTCIFFKPDGTKFYISGPSSKVYQYDLSTAWDLSTATYAEKYADVSFRELTPTGISFNDTGTKFFVSGKTTNGISLFSVGTAWDISTAVDSATFDENTYGVIQSVTFSSGGDKLYAFSKSAKKVYKFSLNDNFDPRSYTYISEFSDSTNLLNPVYFYINPTEDKIFILEYTSSNLYQYNLSTPGDLSTASFYKFRCLKVVNGEDKPTSFVFSNDGKEIYVTGSGINRRITTFEMTNAYDISKSFVKTPEQFLPSNLSLVWANPFNRGDANSVNFWNNSWTAGYQMGQYGQQWNYVHNTRWIDDGNKQIAYGQNSITQDFVYEFQFEQPYNYSSIKVDEVDFAIRYGVANTYQDQQILSVSYKPESKKIYGISVVTADNYRANVYQFTVQGDSLGTTISDDIVKYIEEPIDYIANQPTLFRVTSNGKYLFIGGRGEENSIASQINVYEFTVPWSVNTISYKYSISTTLFCGVNQGAGYQSANDIRFENDGYKCILLMKYGTSTNRLFTMDLTTPYDLRTNYNCGLTLGSINSASSAIQHTFWKPDGTRLYVTDGTVTMWQIDVNQPWRLGLIDSRSAANKIKKISINGLYAVAGTGNEVIGNYNATVDDLAFNFNNDGTKLYFYGTLAAGSLKKSLSVYELQEAWDITSIRETMSYPFGAVGDSVRQFRWANSGYSAIVNTATNTNGYGNIQQIKLNHPYSLYSNTTNVDFQSVGSKHSRVYIDDYIWKDSPFVIKDDGSEIVFYDAALRQATQIKLKEPYEINSMVPWSVNVRSTIFFTNIGSLTTVGSTGFPNTTKLRDYYITPDESKILLLSDAGYVYQTRLSNPGYLCSINGGINPISNYDYLDNTSLYRDVTNTSQTTYSSFTFSNDGYYVFYMFEELNSSQSWAHKIFRKKLEIPFDVRSETWNWASATYATDRLTSTSAFLNAKPASLKFDSTGKYLTWINENHISSNAKVNLMVLDTPYDVANGNTVTSFTNSYFYTNLTDAWITDDGFNLYTVQYVTDRNRLAKWLLSTPWDLTSTLTKLADYDVHGHIGFPTSIQTAGPTQIKMMNDGNSFIANVRGALYQVGLSTSNTFTTTSLEHANKRSPALTSQVGWSSTTNFDANISDDGKSLYILTKSQDAIYEYNMSTSWNVFTMTGGTAAEGLSVGPADTEPVGFTLECNDSGLANQIYLHGYTNDRISQITLPTPGSLSGAVIPASSDSTTPVGPTKSASFASATGGVGTAFDMTPDKKYFTIINGAGGVVTAPVAEIGNLQSFGIHSANGYGTLSDNFANTSNHTELGYSSCSKFGDNGNYFYVTNNSTDQIWRYTLSTPYDISASSMGATYDHVIDLTSFDADFENWYLNGDGTKMYFISSITIHQWDLTTAWDISTYTNYKERQNFQVHYSHDVGVSQTEFRSLSFNSDGTKAYISAGTNTWLFQYTLETPWDLMTATLDEGLSIFPGDGTKLPQNSIRSILPLHHDRSGNTSNSNTSLLFSYAGHTIGEVFLANNNYLSAIAPSQKFLPNVFTAIDTTTGIYDLSVDENGEAIYYYDNSHGRLRKLTLQQPWSLTNTATFNANVKAKQIDSLFASTRNGASLNFADDGNILYIGTNGTFQNDGGIAKWMLDVPYDITSKNNETSEIYDAFYIDRGTGGIIKKEFNPLLVRPEGNTFINGAYYSMNQIELPANLDFNYIQTGEHVITDFQATPVDFSFNNDGTRAYITGVTPSSITQLNLRTPYDITDPYLNWRLPVQSAVIKGFYMNPEGNKAFVLDDTWKLLHEFDLLTPNSISHVRSTATYMDLSQSYAFRLGNYDGPQFNTNLGLSWHPSGNSFFILDQTSPIGVKKINVGTPWDLTTVKWEFAIAAPKNTLNGVSLEDSGNLMFAVTTTNEIYKWELSVPYELSSANLVQTYDLSANSHTYIANMSGIKFANNGYDMLTVDYTSDRIIKGKMTTPYDLSTLTNTYNYSEGSTQGIAFGDNGTKLYSLDQTKNCVWVYELPTPYSVSTMILNDQVPIGDDTSQGMSFKTDGTKFFLIDSGTDKVKSWNLSTAWDLRSASFETSFSVAGQEATPQGVVFKPDGTKMYITGSSGDDINEYDLSTAWDISTASYVANGGSGQDTLPIGIRIKPDGTRLWMVGQGSDDITQLDFSTPWDITTLGNPISLQVIDLNPTGMEWNNDGTAFIVHYTNRMTEYKCATAWDIFTAYNEDELSVTSIETLPVYAEFNNDGTKLFFIGTTGDDINALDLSVPYAIGVGSSTAYNNRTLSPTTFSVGSQEATPQSLSFSPDGTKVYVTGTTGDDINQYNLSTAWDISSASYYGTSKPFVVSPTNINTQIFGALDPTGFSISEDGKYVFVCKAYNIMKYEMLTPWDITTLQPYNFVTVTSRVYNGLTFSPDGSQMYISYYTTPYFMQYTLSEPWKLHSANLTFEYTTADVGAPRCMDISHDGTKIITYEYATDALMEHTLSTPWDLSTLTANTQYKKIYVSATDNLGGFNAASGGGALHISSDGTKLFLADAANKVYEFKMNTPYDISTLTNDIGQIPFNTTTPTLYPNMTGLPSVDLGGMSMISDGTKMLVYNKGNDSIQSYSLSTPWDIFTASVDQLGPTYNYWRYTTAAATPLDTEADYGPSTDTMWGGIQYASSNNYMYFIDGSQDEILTYEWDGVNANTTTFNKIPYYQALDSATGHRVLEYNDDGTRCFVLNTPQDCILQFDSPLHYKLNSCQLSANLAVGSEESGPTSFRVKPDGTSIYVIGTTGDDITQYDMSTAWDLNTASYITQSAALLADPTDFAFSSDGTKVYWVRANQYILQYGLSTGWDLSTINTTPEYTFNVQDILSAINLITGIEFNPDGTKCFIKEYNTNRIHTLTLSTAWDISTSSSSYDNSTGNYQLAHQVGQDLNIIRFAENGKRMFIGGIYEYRNIIPYGLTEAYNVQTIYCETRRTLRSDSNNTISLVGETLRHLEFGDNGNVMVVTSTNKVGVFNLRVPYVPGSGDMTSMISKFMLPYTNGTLHYGYTGYGGYTSVKFNGDGTKIFIAEYSNDVIYSFDLGTPWDLNTIKYKNWYPVGTQAQKHLDINSSGNTIFTVARNSYSDVSQLKLDIPWDLSSLNTSQTCFSSQLENWMSLSTINSFEYNESRNEIQLIKIQATDSTYNRKYLPTTSIKYKFKDTVNANVTLDFSGQSLNMANLSIDDTITDVQFAGQNLFAYFGNTSNLVVLSTEQDFYNGLVETNSYINTWSNVNSFSITANGELLFAVTSGNSLPSYTFTTANTLADGIRDTYGNSFANEETSIEGIYLSTYGNNAYVIGGTNTVYQYSTSNYSMGGLSLSNSFDISNEVMDATDVSFSSYGNTMYVIDKSLNKVVSYDLSTNWNVSTAVSNTEINFTTDLNQELDFDYSCFSHDGNYLYFVGKTLDKIFQFSLNARYDATKINSSYNSISFSSIPGLVSNLQLTNPSNISVSHDGYKLFVRDNVKNKLIQLNFGTPNDLSTLKFNGFNHNAAERAIYMDNSGYNYYFVNTTSDEVKHYSLTTAFDLTTASLSNTLSITSTAGFATSVYSIKFKPDGTKMYLYCASTERVIQYSLSTAWDLSSASYTANDYFYFGSQSTAGVTIFFNLDGTKMYLTDTNKKVWQYSLSTAWDITTASYDDIVVDLGIITTNMHPFVPNSYISSYWYEFEPSSNNTELLGSTGFSIVKFKLKTASDISSIDVINSKLSRAYYPNATEFVAGSTSGGFIDNGNKLYVTNFSGGSEATMIANLYVPYDIDTINFTVITPSASTPSSVQNFQFYDQGKIAIWHDNLVYYKLKLRIPYNLGELAETYIDSRWERITPTSYQTYVGVESIIDMKFRNDGKELYLLNRNGNETNNHFFMVTTIELGESFELPEQINTFRNTDGAYDVYYDGSFYANTKVHFSGLEPYVKGNTVISLYDHLLIGNDGKNFYYFDSNNKIMHGFTEV